MKRFIFFVYLLLMVSSNAQAEPPVGEVIEYHRTQMGMSVNITGTNAIDQLNRQLLAQRYPNAVRLSRLTNYFQALYTSAMSSNNFSDVNRAYQELGRINTLALGTEGVNPAAGEWTRPRLEQIRNRIRELENQQREVFIQSLRDDMSQFVARTQEQLHDRSAAHFQRLMRDQPDLWTRNEGYVRGDPTHWRFARLRTPEEQRIYRQAHQVIRTPAPILTEPVVEIHTRPGERGLAPGQRHRTPSPGLERSFPELVLVPIFQRALLPVSETIIEIGTAIVEYRDQYDYPRIRTPYEEGATQEMTTEALRIRQEVQDGRTLYRLGTRFDPRNPDAEPVSNTGPGSQFWGLRNPATFEGYGETHAMPTRNFQEANFIERATMREGGDFIVRRIPPFTDRNTGITYPGGEYEVVVPENTVQMEGHHSL